MKIKTFEEMKKYKVRSINRPNLETFNDVNLSDSQTPRASGNLSVNPNYPCVPGKGHTSVGGTLSITYKNAETHTKHRPCGNGCGSYWQYDESHRGSPTCQTSATCTRYDKDGNLIGCGSSWKKPHNESGGQFYSNITSTHHTWNVKCSMCNNVVRTNTNTHSGRTCAQGVGNCQYCGRSYTPPHEFVDIGNYEGTHHIIDANTGGHIRYKNCKNCSATEYYKPTKYLFSQYSESGYSSTHSGGKGHQKIGKCEHKVGGRACGTLQNIPDAFAVNWGTPKWFPYDEKYCIQGKPCSVRGCGGIPEYNRPEDNSPYDIAGGSKQLHKMNQTTKVCEACGWSDRPPQWEWTNTERRAFNRVSGYYVSHVTWGRWNEFVEHVQTVVNWFYGNQSGKPNVLGAKMSSSNRVLTASRFNTVRSAIGGMNATGINTVYPGDTVYGSYFITLEDRLNNIKK